MRHFILSVGVLLGSFLTLNAQTYQDIFRFSQKSLVGASARSAAMGNSLSAIGGDPGSILINPAGLGVYKNNEVQLSPTLWQRKNFTSYDGNTDEMSNGSFFISNLSGVFPLPDISGDWKNASFSLGLANRNVLDVQFKTEGINRQSSLLDYFQNQANSLSTSAPEDVYTVFPNSAGLAYDAFLLNYDTSGNSYTKAYNSANPEFENSVRIVGRQRDFYAQMGGNYADKLYVGGGLVFHVVDYTFRNDYTEIPSSGDTSTNLNNFSYEDYFQIRGGGVALQLGAIWRATPYLRVSASFRSRDYMTITDRWGASMDANFSTRGELSTQSQEATFTYRMQTPSRFGFGAAYILKKRGLLTGSVGLTNYKRGRFLNEESDILTDFSGVNSQIQQLGKIGLDVNLGAEIRMGKFTLRGGYAYIDSPQAGASDLAISTWSGGVGVNFTTYYFDLSFSRRDLSSFNYYMYGGGDEVPLAPVSVTPRIWYSTLSGGSRF